MKIDRYTKVVLTIIAVGIIGLNVHFFKDDFIKEAHAVESHVHHSWEWWASGFVEDIAGSESHRHYSSEISRFKSKVEDIVEDCKSRGEGYRIRC